MDGPPKRGDALIETIRRLVMGLALAGYSCTGGGQPPQPPQPPSPPPPEPQCVEGQACGCWHHPPEALGWLYACCQPGVPGGVVNVQDPAQCVTTPPPPDPPEPPVPPDPPVPPPASTDCDGEPGAQTGQITSVHGSVVNEVMRDMTGCSIGSDCNLGNTTQQQFLRAVIDGVRARGKCAGQHEPGVTDEIAISDSPTGIREGGHVFGGDDSPGPLPPGAWRKVVWFPGAARPSYFAGTSAPPDPPAGGCTAPQPPILWTAATIPPGFDQGLIGHTRYEMFCVAHGNAIDCTAKNVRACEYCAAIGMGESSPGVQRCDCPVRNECPGTFKCEERVACEQYLTGGTELESRNGATCEFVGGNPFVFRPSGGNCRLCGKNGTTYSGARQGCGGWY
jgi:hypothetical protein